MNTFLLNATSKKSILLLHDSERNLCSLQTVLKNEGYKVTVTNNRTEALGKISESVPDLLLLDTPIIGSNSYEITEEIKQNSNLPFIPILLMLNSEDWILAKALNIGVDEFILKPVEEEELLIRVRTLLRLKHSIVTHQKQENFVAHLTHDLRTPLIAADRVLELIHGGALGNHLSEIKGYLKQIRQSNYTVLEMVDTLLEVYQYEAGSKTLGFFIVDLWELTQQVIRELIPLADSKRLSMKNVLNCTEISSVKVRGDRLELRRLLTNLVANAIHFTDVGSVEVRLSLTNQWVIIEVEDTGIGMSQEEQLFLFDRFRQGKHQRKGNGLGLYLSRQIVEAHQGTIWRRYSEAVTRGKIS
jgi:signal transduction histidine kinase